MTDAASENVIFEYPGMPEGDDWRAGIATRNLKDGIDGFEVRVVDDLEAVGVRVFRVGDLGRAGVTPPAAVPVLVDWLTHLDERVPGPETQHRAMLRRSLLWALRDVKATTGNRGAVDAIFQQLDRVSPPVEPAEQIWAAEHLARIADASDYDRMVALYERPGVEAGIKVAVAMYVGRYKRPRSREIALEVIAADWVGRPDAIRALAKVGGPEDAATISRFADDPNPATRRAVVTALTKLRA